MGGDYYDRDVVATTSSTGYSEASAKVVGKVNQLHSSLNPQRWKDEKLRTDVKNPIVFALDVTGSMGDWTKIIYDKMPMFYGQVLMQNYLEDPAISFCAVGDYTCDEAPLQVTEFGQGREIDQLISKMYLEGGGGGSFYESYELAAYFYNTHVELENSELPFFFVTGDESFYEKIPEKHITRILGKPPLENYIVARDAWKLLMNKFNVFLIKKVYPEEKKEEKIIKQWNETIGEERVLVIDNPKACIDVMLGAIAITSGNRTLEQYQTDMKDRGQTGERIVEVTAALKKFWDKHSKKENNKKIAHENLNSSSKLNPNVEDEKKLVKENLVNELQEEDPDNIKMREDLKALKLTFGSVPEELICPITGDIFVDPVMTCDGHTYERKAIESWLEKHKTSPATNLNLNTKNLIPNFVIKQLVRGFYEENINKFK